MAAELLIGQWTRGWEIVGHWCAMAKAAALRHVCICMLVGIPGGMAWFWQDLDAAAQEHVGDYILSGITQELRSAFDVAPSSETAFQYAYLRDHAFGQRSVEFLGRQWLSRCLLVALVAGLLIGIVMIQYGRRIKAGSHLRGSEIHDVEKERKKRRIRRTIWTLFGGMMLVLVHVIYKDGWNGVALVIEHGRTWLALHSEWAAKWMSQNGDGQRLWYNTVAMPGFRDPLKVEAVLNNILGGSFPSYLGKQLVTSVAVAACLTPLWLLERRKNNDKNLILADVAIPPDKESSHFLFCGSPGSGKSTAIKELLRQIRQRGERAIVYDCSGEYVEHFYRPNHDIILNPFDKRSVTWVPWPEIRGAEDYINLGRSLYPQNETKDPFWADGSAILFATTLELLAEQGKTQNKDIRHVFFEQDRIYLQTFLKGTPAEKFVDKDAGTMPANLIANVTSKLAMWKQLRDTTGDEKPFSIRAHIETPTDKWLFFSAKENQAKAVRPLISLWCDLASTAILSSTPEKAPRTWVILDEVASLQKLPALPGLLERGRKHGAACMLGLQSMAQLRDTWGRDGAEALASQPQTWLILRSVEPNTADFLAKSLGDAERTEAQESMSMGADSLRDGVSIQQRRERRALVLRSEIINLPDFAGFLNMPGDHPIYRVRFAFPSWLTRPKKLKSKDTPLRTIARQETIRLKKRLEDRYLPRFAKPCVQGLRKASNRIEKIMQYLERHVPSSESKATQKSE